MILEDSCAVNANKPNNNEGNEEDFGMAGQGDADGGVTEADNVPTGGKDGGSQTIDDKIGQGRKPTEHVHRKAIKKPSHVRKDGKSKVIYMHRRKPPTMPPKFPEGPCLIDTEIVRVFNDLFPSVDWDEDLWAVTGPNPINWSLESHGHEPLTLKEMKRLQKAAVISAIGYERWPSSPHLTWDGFVKPFLLLFGQSIRQFLVELEGYGLRDLFELLSGRHAIVLCWIAIDISFGSGISFKEYMEKLCGKETITRWETSNEPENPALPLFLEIGTAASLIYPYQAVEPAYKDDRLSLHKVFATRMNDYAAIAEFSRLDAMRFYQIANTPVQPCESNTFSHQELSLPSILKATTLKIYWCQNLNDHLCLGQEHESRFLTLYWPCSTGLIHSQLARISHLNSNCRDVKEELLKTCAILFASSNKLQEDVKHYGKLEVPDWMCTKRRGFKLAKYLPWLNTHLKGLERLFARTMRIEDFFENVGNKCLDLDVATHFGRYEGGKQYYFTMAPSIRFDDYKVFGERLRVLKAYMDLQQPKGIRQLWRDTRNKKDWYTFWAVIIIGGIGLIFAAASFAVSAAQTVATFQALQLQLNQPSQTSSAP